MTSRIEKIKTIILVCLIFLSLLLTYRLWFNDHNLFSILGIFDNKNLLKSQYGLESLYYPTKIIANLDKGGHVIINSTNDQYSLLQKEAANIVKKLLETGKFETLDIEEWNNLLSTRSIMFGYETDVDAKLISKALNVSNQNIDSSILNIKDIIVIQEDNVSENTKCYIRDIEKGKIYQTRFNYSETAINSLLSKIEAQSLTNYLTGYELKHKLLKDDVLIADDELKGKQIKFEKEVNLESNIQVRNFAQRFFEKFNVVKNIEYKSEDKSRIIQKEFIDRKRILRIFENGQIVYTSAEIPNVKGQVDKYTALKTAIGFIQSTSSLPQNSYISEIKELGDLSYLFSFDYIVEGQKVKIGGEGIQKHAIEIEVKGNVVSSYKRFVKNVDTSKEKEINVQNLKAIDEAVKEYRQKNGVKDIEKAVKEVNLVYVDNSEVSSVYPNWYILIDNQEYLINSVTEEK